MNARYRRRNQTSSNNKRSSAIAPPTTPPARAPAILFKAGFSLIAVPLAVTELEGSKADCEARDIVGLRVVIAEGSVAFRQPTFVDSKTETTSSRYATS